MAKRLRKMKIGEISLCKDGMNDDARVLIVKAKTPNEHAGRVPVLKETDMSDHNDVNEEVEGFEVSQEYADGVIGEWNELDEAGQADALVQLVAERDALAESAEEITKAAVALRDEYVEMKPKFEELKKSAAQAASLIEKMRAGGKADDQDTSLIAVLKAQNGGVIDPATEARIVELEKSKEDGELKDAINKAKTYNFGKAEDVAGLETRIRKGKTTAADADAFVALIKQAGAIAKSSKLFTPIGEDGGNVDANSPIAKANSGVDLILKANPNMTRAQAMTKYWQDNPAEYAAMRQGQAA